MNDHLSEIELVNFQSHKNTVIKFHKNITVFFGLSDSGKSSIVRALKAWYYRDSFYLTTGENTGSISGRHGSFILTRNYQSAKTMKCPTCKTEVTGKVCVCGEVIKDKTGSDSYSLKEDGSDPVLYQKFGKKLPEQLTSITKVFPIDFIDFNEKLNLFNQHDDMFFIGPSYAGLTRNKILSSLIPDSEKVDKLIKKLSSDISVEKTKFEIVQNDLIDVKVKKMGALPIKDALEILVSEYNILIEQLKKVNQSISDLKTLKVELKKTEKVEKFSQDLNKLATVIVNLKKVQSENNFDDKIFSLKNIKNDLKRTIYPELDATKLETFDTSPMIKIETCRNVLSDVRRGLETTDFIMMQEQSRLNEVDGILTSTKNDAIKLLESNTCLCPVTMKEYCDSCKDFLKGEING